MKKRPSESSTEEAVAAAVMKEEEAEVKTTTSPLDGGRTSSRLREKNPTYSKRGIVVSPSTSLASATKGLQNEKYDESEDHDSTKAKTDELVPTRRSNRDIQVSEEQASPSTDQRPLKRLPGLLPCIYSISLTIFFLVIIYLHNMYQKIRLKGSAHTFYRRLNDLFFSQNRFKAVSAKLTRKSQTPNIYMMDDFLTKHELDYFDYVIQQCPFERSFVDNMDYGNNDNQVSSDGRKKRQRRTILDSTHRTSSFYGFRKLHNSRITALEQRIAEMMGCWVHQIEALQLVRYRPGQFFGIHHDLGDLREDDSVILPKKNLAVKRRVMTIFCYLNTLGETDGGCTYFPKAGSGDDDGLRVPPKRGRAVLWSNILSNGMPDPLTIHAGEPVSPDSNQVKYGLNIWICEE